jgi:hypothetical protein
LQVADERIHDADKDIFLNLFNVSVTIIIYDVIWRSSCFIYFVFVKLITPLLDSDVVLVLTYFIVHPFPGGSDAPRRLHQSGLCVEEDVRPRQSLRGGGHARVTSG